MADFSHHPAKSEETGQNQGPLTEEPGGNPIPRRSWRPKPRWRNTFCTKNGLAPSINRNKNDQCEPLLFVIFGDQRDTSNAMATQRELSKNLRRLGFRGTVIGFDWFAPIGPVRYLGRTADYARDSAKRFRDDCISTFCFPAVNCCEYADSHSGAWQWEPSSFVKL